MLVSIHHVCISEIIFCRSCSVAITAYKLPLVRPYESVRIPPDEFPWNLILGDLHGNLSRNSKFGLNRAKISGTLHEDIRTFYCCRRHLRATLHIFMLLTVTCGSTTHTERTVAFQVKQWLRERVTMLTFYVHCLSCYISDKHWMAYNRKVDRGVYL